MKLLIVKMSSLGDVIHTIPLAKILKERFKEEITIDWVVNKEYVSLISNNGIVRNAIPFDRKEWVSFSGFFKTFSEIKAFSQQLKKEHYDVVFDVQGLLKSALVTSMASGRISVGFSDAREGATFFYNKKIMVKDVMHAVEKNLLFLYFFKIGWDKQDVDFPIYVSEEDKAYVDSLLNGYEIRKDYAVFCPFSRWNTKMWEEQRFHKLAEMINSLGIDVVWTGSKNEKLVYQTKNDFTGKLSLNQLYYLFKKSRFVVTCDSGAMHLATAAKANILAIFGPTSPLKTGPYSVSNKAVVVQRDDISCVPCFRKSCDKKNICLDIAPEKVFKIIKEQILI